MEHRIFCKNEPYKLPSLSLNKPVGTRRKERMPSTPQTLPTTAQLSKKQEEAEVNLGMGKILGQPENIQMEEMG